MACKARYLVCRATIEDFSTTMTGIVIAGYFVGFALGSLVVPTLVTRVGHIRVFAAVASLISIATILPPVFVNPWVWTLLRVFIGLGYAGLYIVAESWVNDAAPNANRGRLLSIYMVISLACMAAGPLLVNLADPGGFVLFILASALVSAALIPVLLTVRPAPRVEAPSKMTIFDLYRNSPLAGDWRHWQWFGQWGLHWTERGLCTAAWLLGFRFCAVLNRRHPWCRYPAMAAGICIRPF
jgi:MFS family permease